MLFQSAAVISIWGSYFKVWHNTASYPCVNARIPKMTIGPEATVEMISNIQQKLVYIREYL